MCLTPCAAVSGVYSNHQCVDGASSDVVDVLNVTAGTWSTAALSAARGQLAATSLPNLGVAIFAGGNSTRFLLLFELFHEALLCEGDACVAGV